MKIKTLTPDPENKSLNLVVTDATVVEMINFFYSLKDLNDGFDCQKGNNEEVSSTITFKLNEEYESVYKAVKKQFNIV